MKISKLKDDDEIIKKFLIIIANKEKIEGHKK